MKKAIYKVPNGKLLKIFLEEKNGAIGSIKITGDFFLYPEENLEALEKELRNCALSPDMLTQKISAFLTAHPTNLFGLDVESLVSTIMNVQ